MSTHDDLAWTVPVPVAGIPEEGLHTSIEANEAERVQIARLAGLQDLQRLTARFDLHPGANEQVRVEGTVSAIVGQTCVVTLERVENTVEEAVDLTFVPEGSPLLGRQDLESDGEEGETGEAEPPEPLVNGTIDLAKIAVEFLMLGLDPYPRKPGAVFEPVVGPVDPADHPFAGLAALKDGKKAEPSAKPGRKRQ